MVVFVLLAILSVEARADYVYGSSAIVNDDANNTVRGYSRTELDYDAFEYYTAYVCGELYKDGVSQVRACQGGYITASINTQFTGVSSTSYLISDHYVDMQFYDEENQSYDDYSGYSFLPGYTYPTDWLFYPAYQFTYHYPQSVRLGSTDVQSCGHPRDAIIAEYTQYNVNLAPSCADFTQTRHGQYFTFGELNTGDFAWALIRDPLIVSQNSGYGLDRWRAEYGSGRHCNSCYRNPAHNAAIGGAAQSRHMYGDAADLRNDTRTENEWTGMQQAAQRANADYIEPRNGPCDIGCVHADWRGHAGGYQ
jgi:hypothetical protein